MSLLAKVRWTFAAKNARSATREGLWVGVLRHPHQPSNLRAQHPHPNPPLKGDGTDLGSQPAAHTFGRRLIAVGPPGTTRDVSS